MTRMRTAVAAGLGVAMLIAVVPAGGAPSVAKTADQRFVTELASARTVSKSAAKQLRGTPPSIEGVSKAKAALAQALKHLRAASSLAPQTVGATQSEPVVTGLQDARVATSAASAGVKKGDYDGARIAIDDATAAMAVAQSSFGVPVAKDFSAFAVFRDFSNIQGFEDFLGLTAKVNMPIAKIVFGLAGRETANMGEPTGKRGAPSIPITKLALYTLQEPSGAFSSNWCKLQSGIAVCDLDPTMAADEIFSVAFGPRVAKGTRYLVKFWSTDGKRSHAIMTTR